MVEKFTVSDGSVRWTHYLVSAGGLVGMHVENSDETVATRYFHKDHLGSIAVITSETAVVLERLSFDASKRSLAPPRRASRGHRPCRVAQTSGRGSG